MKNSVWKPAPTIKTATELLTILQKNRPQINIKQSTPTFTDEWWKMFSDPFELSGMSTACQRILSAVEKKERIIVFGDFDSDGITSTVILTKAIANLGGVVSYRIPDRTKDNHGLKNYLFDEIASKNVALVITCDCGINDFEEVSYAKSLGIDTIITDHHTPKSEKFPKDAIAVINPKLNPNFKDQELSGSAVALKLVQALAETKYKTKAEAAHFWKKFIEISAIGVVADCVDLVEENRLITQLGLQNMTNTEWHGLQCLFETNPSQDQITEETIGFFIAPHLNAASRIGDRLIAAQLFLGNPNKTKDMVAHLQNLNKARKELTKTSLQECTEQVKPNQKCQIVFSEHWLPGILGLIASRITEQTGTPTIACTQKPDGTIGASGRSVQGVSIIEVLNQPAVAKYLQFWGGHAGAAGFVCQAQNFEALKESIKSQFEEIDIPPKSFVVEAWIDQNIVSQELIQQINQLAPFGTKNPKPILGFKQVFITEQIPLGNNQEHHKFKGILNGNPVEFVSFFTAPHLQNIPLNQKYDVLFYANTKTWNEKTDIQYQLVDMKK